MTTAPLAYIRSAYGVPAEIGRRVTVDGKPGIIVADRGAHLGVTFDHQKPGVVSCCHPTWRVVYGEMGTPRPLSRSRARWLRYLEIGDCFTSFREFLAYESAKRRELSP
jgi:hypothetical protein